VRQYSGGLYVEDLEHWMIPKMYQDAITNELAVQLLDCNSR